MWNSLYPCIPVLLCHLFYPRSATPHCITYQTPEDREKCFQSICNLVALKQLHLGEKVPQTLFQNHCNLHTVSSSPIAKASQASSRLFCFDSKGSSQLHWLELFLKWKFKTKTKHHNTSNTQHPCALLWSQCKHAGGKSESCDAGLLDPGAARPKETWELLSLLLTSVKHSRGWYFCFFTFVWRPAVHAWLYILSFRSTHSLDKQDNTSPHLFSLSYPKVVWAIF